MAWVGLDLSLVNADAIITAKIRDGEKSLYKTKKGKKVEGAAKTRIQLISQAIIKKSIPTIIALEKQAIEAEQLAYGGEEKRRNTLAVLTQIENLVRSTSTPAGAKSYLIAQNGGTLPSKIPSSDLVQRFVKSHKSYLTHLIEGTSSPALKALHSKRKDALDVIKKEYEKNLQLGLGQSQSKGLSR